MNNYTVLHCHSDLSNGITNIDSITKYTEYIKKAKECGMTAIAFSEHGSVLSWVHKKQDLEAEGLKYIHAEEFYITETLDKKIRDNYHCLLIAKNYNGVLEINKLSTKSFNREDNSFYYVPRISYDDLKNTSDDIIICTACLGGILNKASSEMKNDFFKFIYKNKKRCYLELQPHLSKEQIEYNQLLYGVSKKYGIKTVMCTDTHALNKTHVEGRKILQKAKGIHFDGEDEFHLEFLDYNELVNLCEQQNAIPLEGYLEAIENTNKIADQVEVFELDYSYKYPHLWGKDSETLFRQKINNGIVKRGVNRFDNYKEYLDRIEYEMKAYIHNGAIDFMLLMEDIISWCHTVDIDIGYGRGSVNGSVIAWLIGITEMDSIKHNLNFDRFMNVERVSLSDIDTDFPPSRIDEIKQYIFNKHGLYCSDIVTFNTIALKGAIRDVGRALEMPLDVVGEICDDVETKEDKLREKYKELFKYVDMVNGTIVSIGNHPCGMICSPESIHDKLGLLTTLNDSVSISQVNMKEVDSLNYVKLDLLKLDTIELIDETCKLAEIERITPDNIDIGDIAVWNSIRDDTTGIFQWEGATGDRYIKQLLSDKNIKAFEEIDPNIDRMTLLSIGNSAIRPAGASYRDDLGNGVVRKSGSQAIDDFLKPTFGYLVFQEQIIQFLHGYCGYTMGEADVVRRHFAKKTGTDKDIPKIKDGFSKTMNKKYNMSKEESDKTIVNFIKVIEDASRYLFSLNHSQPYSYEGYVSGWLRYYYPLQFLTVALNIFNEKEEKTVALASYANKIGIKILPPKFRHSVFDYFLDKEKNVIYKGIGPIKYISSDCAKQLYDMRMIKFESFTDLLVYIIENTTINSRQVKVLVSIGFFEEFGKVGKLLDIFNLFVLRYKKTYVDATKIKRIVEIKEFEIKTGNRNLPITEQVNLEKEYMGYISFTIDIQKRYVYVLGTDLKYTPRITVYCLATGKSIQLKVNKKIYAKNKIHEGDILYCKKFVKKEDWKKTEGGFERTGTYSQFLEDYNIIIKERINNVFGT